VNIRTLLVDDEPAALRGLAKHLQHETDVEIIGQCEDGGAAIEAIARLKPDLVFLDIQMPEISGFDVIEAIGLERMPAVIFVTAFDQFAVRAFDVHAVDYVLKPIDNERFQLALDRARQHLQQSGIKLKQGIAAALEDLGLHVSRRWARRLAIKLNGRVLLIDVNDIDRIEASGNYVEIRIGAQKHLLRETLTNLTSRLDPACFARISRSSAVNIERVRELQSMFNGDFVVVLRDGTEVAGTRRYREQLDRLLG
jgi:two-component system, LytTR family, response regulator